MNARKFLSFASMAVLAVILTACGGDVSGGEVLAGGIGIYLIGSILAFILVVWAVIDLIQKPYPMVKKLIWGGIILVIPFIGAILYLLIGRNQESVI